MSATRGVDLKVYGPVTAPRRRPLIQAPTPRPTGPDGAAPPSPHPGAEPTVHRPLVEQPSTDG
jgi:hypothetical protein